MLSLFSAHHVMHTTCAMVGCGLQVVNERLSPNCKARLTVENDDRASLYHVLDLMKVHKATGEMRCRPDAQAGDSACGFWVRCHSPVELLLLYRWCQASLADCVYGCCCCRQHTVQCLRMFIVLYRERYDCVMCDCADVCRHSHCV
jgi:hypothetical protein